MSATFSGYTGQLWEKLVASERVVGALEKDFLADKTERVSALREALVGKDRDVALKLCKVLSAEEKKALFPEFLNVSRCAHSPFQPAWALILSMPRDWVLANIESAVQPILNEDDESDYWMFLQLFAQIDRDLALRLATTAANHADTSIQELGVSWQTKLEASAMSGK